MLYLTCLLYIPAFVSTPTSINAFLGTTATFNCSATTGAIVWLINGTPLNQLNSRDARVINNGRTLQVEAEEKYNEVNVTCAVLTLDHSESEDLFSNPAVLRIQGMFMHGKIFS